VSSKKEYDETFIKTFSIDENLLNDLEYNSIPQWDSIGHMALMAALEETFSIMMDMDEIIDFSSYKKGIETLKKHNIKF
jgi:acyl carrier protein